MERYQIYILKKKRVNDTNILFFNKVHVSMYISIWHRYQQFIGGFHQFGKSGYLSGERRGADLLPLFPSFSHSSCLNIKALSFQVCFPSISPWHLLKRLCKAQRVELLLCVIFPVIWWRFSIAKKFILVKVLANHWEWPFLALWADDWPVAIHSIPCFSLFCFPSQLSASVNGNSPEPQATGFSWAWPMGGIGRRLERGRRGEVTGVPTTTPPSALSSPFGGQGLFPVFLPYPP